MRRKRRIKWHALLSHVLLAALLIWSFAIMAAADAPQIEVAVEMPSEISPGETFTAAVSTASDATVSMAQFVLRYDSEHLVLENVSMGDLAGYSATVNSGQTGYVYLVWDSMRGVEPNGSWLYCTFRAADAEGNASVWIDTEQPVVFAGNDLQHLSVDTAPGTVAVRQGAAAPPQEVYTPPAAGANNGLTMNSNTAQAAAGESIQLTVSETEPVVWQSSNDAVATVDENGLVHARGGGTVVITALSADGERTAACVITVEGPPLISDAPDIPPAPMEALPAEAPAPAGTESAPADEPPTAQPPGEVIALVVLLASAAAGWLVYRLRTGRAGAARRTPGR